MYLKFVFGVLPVVVALGACSEPVSVQYDTETVKYGKSRVAFLIEKDSPPGCELWDTYPYEVKDGIRIIPMGSSVTKVHICRGSGAASKTTWRQQVGKTTVERLSATTFEDGL